MTCKPEHCQCFYMLPPSNLKRSCSGENIGSGVCCICGETASWKATTLRLKEFSYTPGPRFKASGPHSAEEFREKHLIPALTADDAPLVVDLEGIAGVTASFLEEAFSGVVRELGPEAGRRLSFHCPEHPWNVERAEEFVQDEIDRQEEN